MVHSVGCRVRLVPSWRLLLLARVVPPDYQVRVHLGEIQPLQLQTPHDARVLAIVSKTGTALTANLKAPLLFILERRLGRQVVVNDDQPLQYVMVRQCAQLRKSA